MPLSRSRDYLSIGEVLEAIRPEFPDVSISKLRFLEAEGLISPQRTDSGYRKFYRDDVNRLRYILSLQRDHFLPLKVIKERLAEADSNGGVSPPAPRGVSSASVDAPAPSDVHLSRDELAATAGLSATEITALEEFGIIAAHDGEAYDGNHLVLARAAKGLLEHGLEARHLKMYKQFAEREAALFEQIVLPVTKRRDPDARRHASAALAELYALSRQLRDALTAARLRGLP